MGAAAKALQVAALLGAGAAVGSALFALVTPGELRKQTMLKEMPEQDARLQDAASWRQRLVMDALRKAAATPENVAYKDRWVAGSPGRSE
ncbi:ubiquinol-cytochrome-c reductase complex assembly factor 3 [Perognathus longimembris pacificus]|uniref:ubiquinol-cytochrome-c reductase complex assembly factor 3 n=1 Tax=Perognathus longimembris pacificus TaxID=214514 RepID=UPI0020184AB0|nr:ubiquinol-cytochrome-c reductase complex assembly factor 3 [Perognathus longimembris pacificus]